MFIYFHSFKKHFNIIFQGKAGEEKEEKKETEEKQSEEDVTKLLVEDMKLTGRTLNALLSNGIKTVGGIVRKSEKSLSELEGMGDKAMSEIKRKIKKFDLFILRRRAFRQVRLGRLSVISML